MNTPTIRQLRQHYVDADGITLPVCGTPQPDLARFLLDFDPDKTADGDYGTLADALLLCDRIDEALNALVMFETGAANVMRQERETEEDLLSKQDYDRYLRCGKLIAFLEDSKSHARAILTGQDDGGEAWRP